MFIFDMCPLVLVFNAGIKALGLGMLILICCINFLPVKCTFLFMVQTLSLVMV